MHCMSAIPSIWPPRSLRPAFTAAITTEHVFLDVLADTLHYGALFLNTAPCRLKTLHAVVVALIATCLKLGVPHTRRWCAFAADALRGMKRCYPTVVLGLREVHLSKTVHKEQRDALLFALTNEVFLCCLFFCSMLCRLGPLCPRESR